MPIIERIVAWKYISQSGQKHSRASLMVEDHSDPPRLPVMKIPVKGFLIFKYRLVGEIVLWPDRIPLQRSS